jgi:hypothetical protein
MASMVKTLFEWILPSSEIDIVPEIDRDVLLQDANAMIQKYDE